MHFMIFHSWSHLNIWTQNVVDFNWTIRFFFNATGQSYFFFFSTSFDEVIFRHFSSFVWEWIDWLSLTPVLLSSRPHTQPVVRVSLLQLKCNIISWAIDPMLGQFVEFEMFHFSNASRGILSGFFSWFKIVHDESLGSWQSYIILTIFFIFYFVKSNQSPI